MSTPDMQSAGKALESLCILLPTPLMIVALSVDYLRRDSQHMRRRDRRCSWRAFRGWARDSQGRVLVGTYVPLDCCIGLHSPASVQVLEHPTLDPLPLFLSILRMEPRSWTHASALYGSNHTNHRFCAHHLELSTARSCNLRSSYVDIEVCASKCSGRRILD